MTKTITYLSFVIALFLNFSLGAQNKTISKSFNILENSHPENLDFYTKSIEAADFEQYRLKDEPVRLQFENGFVLELFSAKEVFLTGGKMGATSYRESYPPDFEMPVFSISPDGWVSAKYEKKFRKGK